MCERCKGQERRQPASLVPTQEMVNESRREVGRVIEETGHIFKSSDWLKNLESRPASRRE